MSGGDPTGGKAMSAALLALAEDAPKQMARAVYEFAQAIMLLMKRRVPVDYGTLRDSGLVELPKISGKNISVLLGFGGAAAHYAIYVHEDLEAHHDTGQAKFMSSVLDEEGVNFLEVVAANFARAVGMAA